MEHPRPLFRLFLSLQTNSPILTKLNGNKCPSSMWHWDSNPQPLEIESPPITTRPGLPPKQHISFLSDHFKCFSTAPNAFALLLHAFLNCLLISCLHKHTSLMPEKIYLICVTFILFWAFEYLLLAIRLLTMFF